MTSTRRILIVGSEESGACKMLNLVFGGDAFEGESDDASVKRVKRDFLGMIQLDLLGCCGKKNVIDEFISDEHNLQNTAALVFVFIDTASDPEFNRDLSTFERVAKHVSDVSPNSKVDCVVIKNATKVDENSQVESVFEARKQRILEASTKEIVIFHVSLRDVTSFAAWSTILSCLLPNRSELETFLDEYRTTIDADEVFVVDNSLRLPIAERRAKVNEREVEVATILHVLERTCKNTGRNMEGLSMQVGRMKVRIEGFTSHTRIVAAGRKLGDRLQPLQGLDEASEEFKQLLLARAES